MSGVVIVWCGQCPIFHTVWSMSAVVNVCVVNVVQSKKLITIFLANFFLINFFFVDQHFFAPFLEGGIWYIFRPFSVKNRWPQFSALFPGKGAESWFSAWAEGGGRRAVFTWGQFNPKFMSAIVLRLNHFCILWKRFQCFQSTTYTHISSSGDQSKKWN